MLRHCWWRHKKLSKYSHTDVPLCTVEQLHTPGSIPVTLEKKFRWRFHLAFSTGPLQQEGAIAARAAGADMLKGSSSWQLLAPLPAESERPKQLLNSTLDLVEHYIWLTGWFEGWERTNKRKNMFTPESSLLAVHHQAARSIQPHLEYSSSGAPTQSPFLRFCFTNLPQF